MLLTLYVAYTISFVLLGVRDSLGKVTFANSDPVRIIETTEGKPINTTIVILDATSDDPANQKVTYAIKSENDVADKYITINANTGRISNVIVLDSEDTLTFNFQAEAHAGSEKAKVFMVLNIKNVNDNPPRFESTIHQYVDENSQLNTVFGNIQAVDDDMIDQLIYGLANKENASFAIAKYSGSITLLIPLDYEKQNIYYVNISVSDGTFNAYGTLVVHVNDMDDQGPKFDKLLYHAYLDEGNYTDKLIEVPIHAYDLDFGRNDSVTYSITQGTIGPHTVRIDPTTGKLYISGIIDYKEGDNDYAIQVEATSTTFPPVQSIVLLRITDANDNAPYFRASHYYAKVVENSPLGTYVGHVEAYDKDKGNNSVLGYRLNSTQGLPFIITADGEIQVNGSLDREAVALYTFQVIAEETLTKERYHSHADFTVEIVDVNDNVSQFTMDYLRLNVTENIKPPVVLANLTSVDIDSDYNGAPRYYIEVTADANSFYIDQVTGALTTTRTFDREEKDFYEFKAAIRGTRWDTLQVRVDILDENDNSPMFGQPRYHAQVSEAVPNDTFVTTVQATDPDHGNNSVVSYSIVGGNLGNTFSIDSSGEVKTLGLLDRESIETFSLQILAEDGGNKNCTCELVITVLDVNDNQPAFSQEKYTFSIYENQDVRTVVGTVLATDPDKGTNGDVTYRISPPNRFVIDERTGTITTRQRFDREEQSAYTLLVTASDSKRGSKSRLSGSTEVFVTVLDMNDNRPLLSATPRPILLYRNQTTTGTIIYTFKASDKDVGDNGLVAYGSLSTIPIFLELSSTTGELKVISSLPEHVFQVDLQVKAYCPSLPSSFDILNTTIVFISTNTYRYSSPHTGSIEENKPSGSPLTLHQDIPALKTLGRDRQLFCGDHCPFQVEAGGNITTTRPLDREYMDKYTLFIPIEELFTVVPINVTVLDVDDNAPYCTKSYEFTVVENVNKTFQLDGIKDDDLQTNIVKYEFDTSVISSRVLFNIQTSSLFVGELDYEEEQRYDIQLLISGKNERKSRCYITIHVKDVNDNEPVFEPHTTRAVILETVPIGTLVASVQVTDVDMKWHELVHTYGIQGGNSEGVFRIDSATGNVYTTMSVSIIPSDMVRLFLSANDGTHLTMGFLNITIVRQIDIVRMSNSKKKPREVKAELAQIERSLSIQTNASIKVVQITENAEKTGSIIDVYGIADGSKVDITKALESWDFIGPSQTQPQTGKIIGKSEDRKALVGVIIAMAAVLALILSVGAYLWYQRRKRKRTYTAAVIPSSNNINGTKHR